MISVHYTTSIYCKDTCIEVIEMKILITWAAFHPKLLPNVIITYHIYKFEYY